MAVGRSYTKKGDKPIVGFAIQWNTLSWVGRQVACHKILGEEFKLFKES